MKFRSLGLITLSFLVLLTILVWLPHKDSHVFAEAHRVVTKDDFMDCQFIKSRANDFLKYHYNFDRMNKDLSERTFHLFLKFLDPNKAYFTAEDIQKFEVYKFSIGERLERSDCSFIDEIQNKFLSRMKERVGKVKVLLKKPFNFKEDEYLQTDRDLVSWAKDEKEMEERWRKVLKFLALNMKDIESDRKLEDRILKKYEMIQKDIEEETQNERYGKFINAFANSLDPHSRFMIPVEQAQFRDELALRIVGIGATLTSQDGYTTIDSIIPGGPAFKDGTLQKGDRIVAIDSGDDQGLQDVVDMRLDRVVRLIKGKEDTKVKLLIIRKQTNGKWHRFELILIRKEIQVKDGEAKSDTLKIKDKTFGVVHLPSFYVDYQSCRKDPKNCRSSSNDMRREIEKLKNQNISGIIVDLRKNLGGDLIECGKIVSLSIKDPVVVQIEGKYRDTKNMKESSSPLYTGPLVVLVDRLSASASEIFSGTVQDYGRGLVLGDSSTFGKGTVQSVIDLAGSGPIESGGALVVTIGKFFLASGRSNQEIGITTDVQIPDVLGVLDIGEKYADYALPNTRIPKSRDYTQLSVELRTEHEKNIKTLQEESTKRVKLSKDFQKLTKEIEEAKKERNTLISLKEKPKETEKDKEEKIASRAKYQHQVIDKSDIQLFETGNIIYDYVSILSKNKPKLRGSKN